MIVFVSLCLGHCRDIGLCHILAADSYSWINEMCQFYSSLWFDQNLSENSLQHSSFYACSSVFQFLLESILVCLDESKLLLRSNRYYSISIYLYKSDGRAQSKDISKWNKMCYISKRWSWIQKKSPSRWRGWWRWRRGRRNYSVSTTCPIEYWCCLSSGITRISTELIPVLYLWLCFFRCSSLFFFWNQ